MHHQPNIIAWTCTLMITLFIACGGDGEGPEPGTGEVPAPLLTVEGQAEDAYDRALARDFAAVAASAEAIDAAWRGYRAQAATDGAAAADLTAMDAATAGLRTSVAASTDPVTVGRAANAISAPMDELFALYDPTVPPAILALDYLGRALVLDGTALDRDGATADLTRTQTTWDAVRPAVVDAGGTAAAADYDGTLTALRADLAGSDHAQLVIDANAGLEIVDTIEGVFAP